MREMSEIQKNMIEIAIHDYGEFCTIWITDVSTGMYMPLGKQWKKISTAQRWAEKMKKDYEEQGFEAVIKRRKSIYASSP